MKSASVSGRLRLRVAQLIETMGMGGAERLAVQIANARAAAGDLSFLYVLTGPGEQSRRILPAVRVRYLGYQRVSITNPPAFVASIRRGYGLLLRQLAQDGIDVVQSHLPGSNFWGLLLAWRGGRVVIPTVHNNLEFRYGRDDQAWRAWLRRRAYVEMLRRCAAMVTVSEEVRVSLIDELHATAAEAARIRVVPNGVEIPERLDPQLGAQAWARHGVPGGDPRILAAGRLVEQKNFIALVEATHRLRGRGVRCRVLIAGEGPLRAFLERRVDELGIGDQITFAGAVDDLPELMSGADLFVMPSLWEGLPLVLLEAMACGLPVVGYRIKGVAEVVEDGVSGLLVEPGDVDGLALAIGALAGSAARRAAFGAAGLAIVKSAYDFGRVSRALGALYAEVATPA